MRRIPDRRQITAISSVRLVNARPSPRPDARLLGAVPTREIPDDVLALLRDRVRSLDGLEVLLALRDARPEARSAEQLVAQLRLPSSSISDVLPSLRDAGLLSEDGERWSFRPATEAIAASVQALADAYAQMPTTVMRVLNSLALRQVRSSAATEFANAFVIRKSRRKDDG